MNKFTLGIGLVILVAIGAGAVYMGWKVSTSGQPAVCEVCGRVIHGRTRTIALLGGETREVFCCPMCARTAGRQTGRPVHIVELTDYNTNQPLRPDGAYLTVGSDVNPCLEHGMITNSDKQPAPLDFDRCSPSVLAFGSRDAAEAFRREHGGEVVPFEDFSKQQ